MTDGSDKKYKGSLLSYMENSNTIRALRKGLMLIVPILLVGSMCTVFVSFPISGYQNWIQSVADGNIFLILNWILNATMGSISLYVIISVSYSYAVQIHKEAQALYILAAIMGYLLYVQEGREDPIPNIFGAEWLFTAIFITLFTCFFIRRIHSGFFILCKKIKRDRVNTEFQSIMYAIFPITGALFLVLLMKIVRIYVFGTNMQNIGTIIMEGLFQKIGTGFIGMLLFIFLIHFFWFLGIHGSNILFSVATQMFEPEMIANIEAVSNGAQATNIFTKTFVDVFILMGGSGATMSLLLAVLIVGVREKNRHYKRLFGIGLIPSIFNVNEVVLFGLPVVFNPIMLIPFITVPLVMAFVGIAAMSVGLVPVPSVHVPWTTPIFFSGYLSTGSIRGAILQFVNLIIGMFIYMPFFAISKSYYNKILINNIANLKAEMIACEELGRQINFREGNKHKLDMIDMLIKDLRQAIINDTIRLHYQPQIKNDGSVYGVEALLRWKHPVAGYLYPPMVIELARQDGILDEFGLILIDKAAKDLENLAKHTKYPIHMSVNISPVQFEHDMFCERVKYILEKYDFGDCILCFEVTEQLALSGSQAVTERIEELKKAGIPFHMDDFGMGHSSMKYLQTNEFEAIKLDGSLVRHMLNNERSQQIISGIQNMATPLKYELIAEYVETEEQKNILSKIGCNIYQGTLYSWPLPIAELETFLEKYDAMLPNTEKKVK